VLFLAALAGCAAQADVRGTVTPEVNATAAAAPVIDAGTDVAVRDELAAALRIDPPTARACMVSAVRAPQMPFLLSPKPRAPGFARVFATAASGELLDTGGLFLRLTSKKLTVQGYVEPANAMLVPRRPIVFGGAYVARWSDAFRVTPRPNGKMMASLSLPDPVNQERSWTLEAEVTCDDLALAPVSMNVASRIPPAVGKRTGIWTVAGKALDLALEPKGPTVLRVDPGAGVRVLEEKPGWMRVSTGQAFGWTKAVPLARPVASAPLLSLMIGDMELDSDGPDFGVAAPTDEVTCASPVRVVLKDGTTRWLIGALAARSDVRVAYKDPELWSIGLPPSTADDFQPGGPLYAAAGEMARCASHPVTTDPKRPACTFPGHHPGCIVRGAPAHAPGIEMSGPIDNAEATIKGFKTSAMACFAKVPVPPRGQGKEASLSFQVSLVVAPDGAVRTAAIVDAPEHNEELGACLVAAGKRVTFDRLPDPTADVTVVVPFTFFFEG
jgi:hypothetical protein